MDSLPDELLREIIGKLKNNDILPIITVNKKFVKLRYPYLIKTVIPNLQYVYSVPYFMNVNDFSSIIDPNYLKYSQSIRINLDKEIVLNEEKNYNIKCAVLWTDILNDIVIENIPKLKKIKFNKCRLINININCINELISVIQTKILELRKFQEKFTIQNMFNIKFLNIYQSKNITLKNIELNELNICHSKVKIIKIKIIDLFCVFLSIINIECLTATSCIFEIIADSFIKMDNKNTLFDTFICLDYRKWLKFGCIKANKYIFDIVGSKQIIPNLNYTFRSVKFNNIYNQFNEIKNKNIVLFVTKFCNIYGINCSNLEITFAQSNKKAIIENSKINHLQINGQNINKLYIENCEINYLISNSGTKIYNLAIKHTIIHNIMNVKYRNANIFDCKIKKLIFFSVINNISTAITNIETIIYYLPSSDNDTLSYLSYNNNKIPDANIIYINGKFSAFVNKVLPINIGYCEKLICLNLETTTLNFNFEHNPTNIWICKNAQVNSVNINNISIENHSDYTFYETLVIYKKYKLKN